MPRFADLTAPEIAGLPEDTVAVLGLGAIEQHGPHLPVSTDYVIAAEAAEAAVATVAAAGSASVVLLEPLGSAVLRESHPGVLLAGTWIDVRDFDTAATLHAPGHQRFGRCREAVVAAAEPDRA